VQKRAVRPGGGHAERARRPWMSKLELAPLARAPPLAPPVFGRVVSGVDLRELGPADVAAIDAALLEHGFLLFERQHGLSPADEWGLLSSLSWLDPEFSAAVKGDAVENVAWWQFAELPMVRRLGDAVDSTTGVPIALLNRIGYEWVSALHHTRARARLLSW
jgi:hypothetical protein